MAIRRCARPARHFARAVTSRRSSERERPTRISPTQSSQRRLARDHVRSSHAFADDRSGPLPLLETSGSCRLAASSLASCRPGRFSACSGRPDQRRTTARSPTFPPVPLTSGRTAAAPGRDPALRLDGRDPGGTHLARRSGHGRRSGELRAGGGRPADVRFAKALTRPGAAGLGSLPASSSSRWPRAASGQLTSRGSRARRPQGGHQKLVPGR